MKPIASGSRPGDGLKFLKDYGLQGDILSEAGGGGRGEGEPGGLRDMVQRFPV